MNEENKKTIPDVVSPSSESEVKDESVDDKEQIENIRESTLLEWVAPEFNIYSRGLYYYVASALAFLLVVGYSIFSRDWFIIAIAIILIGFFFWYPSIKPKQASYRITQIGLYVNERIYPYTEINSFYLVVNQKENALNIIFNKKYLPQLTILTPEVDPLRVKTVLAKFIPEQEGRTESIVDKVSRLLRL